MADDRTSQIAAGIGKQRLFHMAALASSADDPTLAPAMRDQSGKSGVGRMRTA